jgi:lipopolysaccharide export system protein LptA
MIRAFFLLIITATAAIAAPTKDIPVVIQAERMEYIHKEGKIIFRDDVHVQREDMDLWANTITVYLEKTKNSSDENFSSQKIKSIIAEGNVRIKAPQERNGTCHKATYDVHTETITMEGNPEVRQGANTIRGDTIILSLREAKSEVRGGSGGRVEAIFLSPNTLPKLGPTP